jgi:hypothetical protein
MHVTKYLCAEKEGSKEEEGQKEEVIEEGNV